MIDQLVDRFLVYAEAFPDVVTNFIQTYGKEVKVYQNDRQISKDYTKVLGTSYTSYMTSSVNYDESIIVHILVDYEDWNKIVQDGAPADFQFIIEYVPKEIRNGDLIVFDMRGVTLTYKITESSTYHKLFYRASAQIVTNRDGNYE